MWGAESQSRQKVLPGEKLGGCPATFWIADAMRSYSHEEALHSPLNVGSSGLMDCQSHFPLWHHQASATGHCFLQEAWWFFWTRRSYAVENAQLPRWYFTAPFTLFAKLSRRCLIIRRGNVSSLNWARVLPDLNEGFALSEEASKCDH